jgi:site-specific DNA-methyltransferase (adenine-specific)
MKPDLTRSFNMDCMDFMKDVPDKFYDLAVVDPPYGIGINMNQGRRKGQVLKHNKKNWDNNAPTKVYWDELCRVSKKQVVWGANNFYWIPPNNGWIVWDKDITGDVDFSKAELAYTSFLNTVQMIKIRAQTGKETYTNKIHPTQKPIKLYEWLLMNYAKEGDKILDTHGGSQSSRIACYNLGYALDIIELDKEYFDQGNKRFETHKQQLTLF